MRPIASYTSILGISTIEVEIWHNFVASKGFSSKFGIFGNSSFPLKNHGLLHGGLWNT